MNMFIAVLIALPRLLVPGVTFTLYFLEKCYQLENNLTTVAQYFILSNSDWTLDAITFDRLCNNNFRNKNCLTHVSDFYLGTIGTKKHLNNRQQSDLIHYQTANRLRHASGDRSSFLFTRDIYCWLSWSIATNIFLFGETPNFPITNEL